jgi:predicted small secreted protein
MRLKNTAVAVLIAASTALTGCAGSNTDVERGETNCDGGQSSQDENCAQTSTPTPADNT